MDKLIRNQIYYQKNKEKLKAERRIRYQVKKKQKAKKLQRAIQREKTKLERKLKKWRLKLHLRQEAYKYSCGYFWGISSWKIAQTQVITQIQEKIIDLEEKLSNFKSKKT